MGDLAGKIAALDPQSRELVASFVDLLLAKTNKTPFDLEAYKKRIQNLSVWTEEDEAAMIENAKLFNPEDLKVLLDEISKRLTKSQEVVTVLRNYRGKGQGVWVGDAQEFVNKLRENDRQ